jgi:hypothetical protein
MFYRTLPVMDTSSEEAQLLFSHGFVAKLLGLTLLGLVLLLWSAYSHI